MLVIFLDRTFSRHEEVRLDPNIDVPFSLPRCCKNCQKTILLLFFKIFLDQLFSIFGLEVSLDLSGNTREGIKP